MHNQTLYFRLQVISPLHIGCDEVYEPTSFVIDEQQQELISFDPFVFLKQLDDGERQKFSAICQKGTITSLLEIYKFIRQHARFAQGERVAVSPSLVEHYQETMQLPANERRIQQELNNFLISRTAFTPLTNLPYVPGSAIKGAVRTAVLNLRHRSNTIPRKKYDEMKPYDVAKEAKSLQIKLLGGTFNTDPFRLVKFSDFVPVGKVKRRVAYAVDCKKKISEKEASAPYQMVETVEPGAEFIGTISITQPDPKTEIKKPVDMTEVRNAIRDFYCAEKTREDRELQAIGVGAVAMNLSDAACPIRVGRHSGAECVTVAGHRSIKISPPGKKPDRHSMTGATTVWLAAGAKKPSNPKSLWPFGWAILEVISEAEWYDLRRQGDELTEERFDQLQAKVDQEEKEREHLRVRQAEEQAARETAECKRRQQEKEDRLYPWRKKVLPSILAAADWGQLKQHALDNQAAKQHQRQPEVAAAVKAVAEKVRASTPKKWTAERDEAVSKWLDDAGIAWQPRHSTPVAQTTALSAEVQEYVDRIIAIKDLGEWKNAKITIDSLPMPALEVLKEKLKAWGCDDKKAKDDKKQIWKEVNSLLRKAAVG